MKTILNTIGISVFILTLMMTPARAQSDTAVQSDPNILTDARITGAWRINYAESDDATAKMRAMLQSKSRVAKSEKTSQKNEELPAMSVSILPPETLVLASDGDERSITINENFSEIVFTRTISIDGVKRFGELAGGANFAVAAAKNNASLVVETESPRGNRMIENYAVADGGKKLIVIVRFEDAQEKEILTLRRVYDRISPNIFPAEIEEMQ